MSQREFISSYERKDQLLASAMEMMGRITKGSEESWSFEFHVPIEVKSNHLDSNCDDSTHWVEIINKDGELGWLYGKASYIAFETDRFWVFVHREELVSFIQVMCKDKTPASELDDLYRIHVFSGEKTKSTKVKTIDLMSICDFLIMKKDNSIKKIK